MSRKPLAYMDAETAPHVLTALFHSRKRMLKRFAERGIEAPALLEGAHAQTFPVKLDGRTLWAVLVETKPEHAWQAHALLCHEAVHVALGHLKEIGDDHPTEEELAYCVQGVAGALIDQHQSMEGEKQ